MPTLRRFRNCKIAVYADDHLPPHFHIEGRGFRVIVAIETMCIRKGDARRAAEALAWARENRGLIQAAWIRFNRQTKP